jgi:hypothetical protein
VLLSGRVQTEDEPMFLKLINWVVCKLTLFAYIVLVYGVLYKINNSTTFILDTNLYCNYLSAAV